MEELIKNELLSLIDEIRDNICDLRAFHESTFDLECICGEHHCFDIKVEVEWETCNYREWGDECDWDYTGEIYDWKLISAITYDEDDNEFEVSQEIINLFNEKK